MSDKNHPGADETPLSDFSNCHAGILEGLEAFAELPALVSAADRARRVGQRMVDLFATGVIEHHAEEEEELFPAVVASSEPGEELDRVKQLVDRLTREHREFEAMWKRLAPAVKKAARGQSVQLDLAEVERLVRTYAEHASFEEAEFLPLSERILGRNSNHMAALGLSLHMRHAPLAKRNI
ncbi:hemerythrin domain-containing protein [Aromatoleum buckelii]|uniref:hemerythrin domain-containing protein n=1 Tax=Aromatoleum buckelii TaxID=200254 RepID=UPI001FF3B15F|nr:hemerythrin domain-containing protein [Aromatoleum buckelii]MCK0509668.1 hemerythrin domain-containing protein [Aromatoleum buckelii]